MNGEKAQIRDGRGAKRERCPAAYKLQKHSLLPGNCRAKQILGAPGLLARVAEGEHGWKSRKKLAQQHPAGAGEGDGAAGALGDVMGGLCPHRHLRQKGEELTC